MPMIWKMVTFSASLQEKYGTNELEKISKKTSIGRDCDR
jgi:hypothetical protein